MTSRIEELWHEHEAARFPAECRLRSVDDIDLVMLDSNTAGCVSTFVSRGTLDSWRLAVLGLCYRDLAVVVRNLLGESEVYFARLEELARLVLICMRDLTRD